MNESVLGVIALTVFITSNIVLRKFTKGKAYKTYQKAVSEHTSVTAHPIKTWIYDNKTHWRGDNRQRAVYQYEVNGKKYKKTMDYEGGYIVLYYKKENPGYAVTESEGRGGDHRAFIVILSFVITIVVANGLKWFL